MKATLQRGLYGEDKQSLEIVEGALLSIFQKGEPVPDSELYYVLCWTNAEYRETCFEAPKGLTFRESSVLAPKSLVVSIYLTDAEFRQMTTRIDEQGRKKEGDDASQDTTIGAVASS